MVLQWHHSEEPFLVPDGTFMVLRVLWKVVKMMLIHREEVTGFCNGSACLLWDWEFWEVRDVPGPLDGAEEQPRRQLTDAVDAHDGGSAGGRLHLALAVRGHVAAAGVRLGPEQLGDELRHRRPVEEVRPDETRTAAGQRVGTDTRERRRDATPLDCCRERKTTCEDLDLLHTEPWRWHLEPNMVLQWCHRRTMFGSTKNLLNQGSFREPFPERVLQRTVNGASNEKNGSSVSNCSS